jgi:hypothetical protein
MLTTEGETERRLCGKGDTCDSRGGPWLATAASAWSLNASVDDSCDASAWDCCAWSGTGGMFDGQDAGWLNHPRFAGGIACA